MDDEISEEGSIRERREELQIKSILLIKGMKGGGPNEIDMRNPAFGSKNLPKCVHKVTNRAFGCIILDLLKKK